MLSTDSGGTHWFLAWHRTRPPAVRWPGTGTGSGPCASPWRISACWSPQSRCQSAARWTCHLREGQTRSAAADFSGQPAEILAATDGLHGVPLLDEELRSGDVDVHPQGLLLLVHRVWGAGVFTGEVKKRGNERRSQSPHTNMVRGGRETGETQTGSRGGSTGPTYLISISARLLASANTSIQTVTATETRLSRFPSFNWLLAF